jgi:hypothetical protein
MATSTTQQGGTPPPADCTPGCETGPLTPPQRADTARQIRQEAAEYRGSQGDFGHHPCNHDEEKYQDRNFCASFTKGLPHYEADDASGNIAGEVIPDAYCKLLKALKSGEPRDFADVPLGCAAGGVGVVQTDSRFAPAGLGAGGPAPNNPRPFVNPQSALAYDLEGADSHQLEIAPAPAFASAEEAGEMIELYWMALARDVPFARYGKEPITQAAIADLNAFIDKNPKQFKGPTEATGGKAVVTPRTLFRGATPGETAGPYLSQFMLLDAPFGAQVIDQRIVTVLPVLNPDGSAGRGKNYMTTFAEWLEIQRGCRPGADLSDTKAKRYIRNGRDLGQYVHIDVLFQAYFNAMLILLQAPGAINMMSGLNAPFDQNNPYAAGADAGKNQEGFGTFGGPHLATTVCEVATRVLKAVWYQKWSVHRRLRPEAFGGRVEKVRTNSSLRSRYDIHRSLFDSQAIKAVEGGVAGTHLPKYGTHLLPMSFPEGSPLHPAYGAGHATVAGACVTILKAWFKEDEKLSGLKGPDGRPLNFVPKEPALTGSLDTDGVNLQDYTGGDAGTLTVGGELNKLAANVGIGRNHAGVHWRSDHDQSIRLGERIAISVLEDQACTYNEEFPSGIQFTFTSFDGTKVDIRPRKSCPKLRP